jgi:flagellum-specific peptidoglycan hydrolase FlgJ
MAYTREQFIKKYGGFIAQAVKGTGILQGTVIAQAILESQQISSDGRFYVGNSKLSREANNYFGIKCSSDWKGKRYNIDTGEETKDGSKYIEKNACFRAYPTVEDSINDYVKFVQENPRYRRHGYFEAKTVNEQTEALQRAGYATSTTYAKTLQGIYNSIKNYADKYNKYGVKGIAKSFVNNPTAFVKRNKVAVALTSALVISLGVGTYFLVKDKK